MANSSVAAPAGVAMSGQDVLHITAVSALVRAPRTPLPATAPVTATAK